MSEPRYWDKTSSGTRLVSRPIVVDGLTVARATIELAPRIKVVNGELVDDSYHAVEHAARQFYQTLTLEQLVMATVALQVHMRKTKEYLRIKKVLQERWTELARRMKKVRVEDEHLTLDEKRLAEKSEELAGGPENPAVAQLLDMESAELALRRESWRADKRDAQALWTELEKADEALLERAPRLGQTEDLQDPYTLRLLAGHSDSPTEARKRSRSLASAMNTLVDALQKPLSRTDQMLLEIALRRCVQASVAQLRPLDLDRFEKDLLRSAEREFLREFSWAEPFLPASASATA
jgi:hypothetical protein